MTRRECRTGVRRFEAAAEMMYATVRPIEWDVKSLLVPEGRDLIEECGIWDSSVRVGASEAFAFVQNGDMKVRDVYRS